MAAGYGSYSEEAGDFANEMRAQRIRCHLPGCANLDRYPSQIDRRTRKRIHLCSFTSWNNGERSTVSAEAEKLVKPGSSVFQTSSCRGIRYFQ